MVDEFMNALTGDENLSEEEIQERLETATEEELNSFSDDGEIPPARTTRTGVIRQELRNLGKTIEDAVVAKQEHQITQEEVESLGWVKVQEYVDWAKSHGIPVTTSMRATGENRGLLPVLHPRYGFRWLGRVRYISPESMSAESLEFLQKLHGERKARAPRTKKNQVPETPEENEGLSPDFQKLSKAQLLKMAQDAGIENVNKGMSKPQILNLMQQEGVIAQE